VGLGLFFHEGTLNFSLERVEMKDNNQKNICWQVSAIFQQDRQGQLIIGIRLVDKPTILKCILKKS